MKRSMLRPKLCRQPELVDVYLTVAGASGTPVAGGIDVAFIRSITDLGVGNYRINFHDVAQRNIIPVAALSSTDGLYVQVTAVDKKSITVLVKTFAGVVTDGDLSIHCLYHQAKYIY